jgi:hypothetical protein
MFIKGTRSHGTKSKMKGEAKGIELGKYNRGFEGVKPNQP